MPKTTPPAKPAAKATATPPVWDPPNAVALVQVRYPGFAQTPMFAQPDGEGSALFTAGRAYIGRVKDKPEDVARTCASIRDAATAKAAEAAEAKAAKAAAKATEPES